MSKDRPKFAQTAPAPPLVSVPVPMPAALEAGNRVSHGVLILFLIIPFAVFYWCCPFIGRFTLGNDYTLYSIGAQMELLYSIQRGSFPLFFPRLADGFSANGLTLGQLYHPFTWIAMLAPGYWSGHALDWMTTLRLLSLGATHYALFRLLRRLRLGLAFSLILSFITVYNLRMLDQMRYGASLENYTAYLLLLTALGWSWIRPLPRWSFLWVALAAWLVVVGGHPQFMYFGMLGAGVMVLVLPFYLDIMLPEEARPGRLLRFYAASYLGILAGIGLAVAYWLPFYWDYLRQETIRTGLTYDWSAVNQDTLLGTLNAFFNPYRSDVHGNFGGSALVLLGAALPMLVLAGVRIPRVIGLLWLLLVLTLAYQLGTATPVHYLFWRYVPFSGSFRVPGRLAFFNPFTLMLLLAWVLRLEPVQLRLPRERMLAVAPYGVLGALAAVAYVLYNLVPLDQLKGLEYFSPAVLYKTVRTGPKNNIIPLEMYGLVYAAGLASLLLLAARGAASSRRMGGALSFALAVAVALQSGAVLRWGTWIELRKPTPTLAQMDAQRKINLGSTALFSTQGELSKAAQVHESRGGSRDPRPGNLYARMADVKSPDEVYTRDLANPWNEKIGVEGGMMILPPVPKNMGAETNTLKLTYGSFNRVVMQAKCVLPAVCTLGFPYSGGRWNARVNGQPVRVFRAYGFTPAVRLPAGESTVDFRYFSATPLVSMIFSFMVAAGLIYWVAAGVAGRRKGLLALAVSSILFSALFIVICYSLYHGQDMGTEFSDIYQLF